MRSLFSSRKNKKKVRQNASLRSRRMLLESLEARQLMVGSVAIEWSVEDEMSNDPIPELIEAASYEGSDETLICTISYDTGGSTPRTLSFTTVPADAGIFEEPAGLDAPAEAIYDEDDSSGDEWTDERVTYSKSVTGPGQITLRFRPFANDGNNTDDHPTVSGMFSFDPPETDSVPITVEDTNDTIFNDDATCPMCSCKTSACSGESNLGKAVSSVFLAVSSSVATGVTQTAGALAFALKNSSDFSSKPIVSIDAKGSQLVGISSTGGTVTTKLTVFDVSAPSQDASGVYRQTKAKLTDVTRYYSPSTFNQANDYRFAANVPSSLGPGTYDFRFDIMQGGTTIKSYYGQTNVENPNPYPEWGPGWSVEGMSRLDLADPNYDGVCAVNEVEEQQQIYVELEDGGKVRFRRGPDGTFTVGQGNAVNTGEAGDFANWKLTFDDVNDEYVITTAENAKIVYDFKGLLKRRADHLGNTISYTYGSGTLAGKLTRIDYPDGRFLTFTYNGGLIESVTDDVGSTSAQQVDFGRDAQGRITGIWYADPDGAGALKTPHEKFDYVSSTDNHISARYRYPEENDTTIESTTFTYDTSGRLLTLDKPNENSITFSPAIYKGMGSTNSGSPATLMLVSNAFGSTTQGGTVVTESRYNQRGQLLQEIDPMGYTWTYTYYEGSATTIGGRLHTVEVDPDGAGGEGTYTTTYSYSTEGLVSSISHPDGTSEGFTYETSGLAKGQLKQYTDWQNNRTKYDYDSSGRLIAVRVIRGGANGEDTPTGTDTNNDDLKTTFEYNATALAGVLINGLPSAMIDPKGYRTEYSYNSEGQLTLVKYAVGASGTNVQGQVSYGYDSSHRLTSITNELGQGLSATEKYYDFFVYDGLGRLQTHRVADPDGTGSLARPEYNYTYDRENRVKTITDPISRLTNYVYQLNGSYSSELPDHDGNGLKTITTYNVDGRGRIASIIDPMHYTTSFAYDKNNNLTQTTYPIPDATYEWQSTQWVTTNAGTPSMQPQTSATYDGLGRPKTETDALGKVTNYYYTSGGNVSTVSIWLPSPGGTLDRPVQRSTYDGNGNLIKLEEGYVAYNAAAGTSPTLRRYTRFVYDDANRLTTIYRTLPDAVSIDASTEFKAAEYVYDKNGNVTNAKQAISTTAPGFSAFSPLMQDTKYVYDARNRMIEMYEQDPTVVNPISDANRPKWTFGYDLHNRLLSVTDPLQHTTNYGYDRLDRQTTVTLPDPDGTTGPLGRPVYTTEYDAANRVTKTIDPIGNYENFYYDALGDNWSVFETDGDGIGGSEPQRVTRYRYDANQRLIAMAVNGARTNYEYDGLGRITKVTQPDPDDTMTIDTYTNSNPLVRPFTSYTYDKNSNLKTTTNELSKVTTYGYDNLNRLTSRTDPAIGAGTPVTSYTYDVLSRMLTLTDPDGNTTTYGYDLLDRVKSEDSPISSITQDRLFEYDLLGNMTKYTDHLSRLTTLTYDYLGRLKQEDWSTVAAPTTFTGRYAYTYDVAGNLLTATGNAPTASSLFGAGELFSDEGFQYYDTNWLKQHTVQNGTQVKSRLDYQYDQAGRLYKAFADYTVNAADFSTGWINDYENTYAYDSKDRVSAVTQGIQGSGTGYNVVGNKYVTFAYNELDQIIDIDRYASTGPTNLVAHTDYDRDSLGRIKKIDHFQGSTHFGTYTINYDARSRITDIFDDFVGTTYDDTRVFTYDDNDQLTATDHTNAVQGDEAYAYDKNGNRTGSQTQLGSSVTYVEGNNNQVASDGVYNYAYDWEGNLTSKTHGTTGEKEEYAYDHRNRLTKTTFKNGSGVIQKVIEYRYDSANQLLRRIETPYTSGVAGTATTDSFVSDQGQIVLAFKKTGTSGNAALTNRYLWASAVDHLLSDEDVATGTTYWAFEDQVGTVRELATYNSGTGTTSVVKHRDYDSFGNLINDSAPTIAENFGYAGRYTEKATGDTHNTFRWYKPRIGQFMSEDPIQSASGQDNWRAYVGNHPTYATDPSGLQDPARFFGQGSSNEASQAAWNAWVEYQQNPGKYAERLSKEEREVVLDLLQLALDIGGIVEPTPGCDAISGTISLFRGQFGDAFINGISILPYLGDTTKVAKVGKYVGTLGTIGTVVGKNPDFARKIKPILEALEQTFKNLPSNTPKSLRDGLEQLRNKLDEALKTVRDVSPNKVPTPSIKAGGKIADEVPKSIPKNWSKPDIEDAVCDYQRSIAARKAEQAEFDKVGGGDYWRRKDHYERIEEEEDFLRQMLRRLREMR